jgi:hypothetical protein
METPNTEAGRLTDRIMLAIQEHIKREPPPQENHHYNRAWSKVLEILTKAHP